MSSPLPQLATPSSSASSSAAADSNWFDVGIIKGTSCTVSSYYLPSGELEKSEIDVEGDENLLRKVCNRLLDSSPLPCDTNASVHRWTCNPAPPTSSAWPASTPAAAEAGQRCRRSRRACPDSPGRPRRSRSPSRATERISRGNRLPHPRGTSSSTRYVRFQI